jgi:hypothetical protein
MVSIGQAYQVQLAVRELGSALKQNGREELADGSLPLLHPVSGFGAATVCASAGQSPAIALSSTI